MLSHLTFTEAIKLARSRVGFTQQRTADLLGWKKHVLVDIERGKVVPTKPSRVRALAVSIGLPVVPLWALAMSTRYGASTAWIQVSCDLFREPPT